MQVISDGDAHRYRGRRADRNSRVHSQVTAGYAFRDAHHKPVGRAEEQASGLIAKPHLGPAATVLSESPAGDGNFTAGNRRTRSNTLYQRFIRGGSFLCSKEIGFV